MHLGGDRPFAGFEDRPEGDRTPDAAGHRGHDGDESNRMGRDSPFHAQEFLPHEKFGACEFFCAGLPEDQSSWCGSSPGSSTAGAPIASTTPRSSPR